MIADDGFLIDQYEIYFYSMLAIYLWLPMKYSILYVDVMFIRSNDC